MTVRYPLLVIFTCILSILERGTYVRWLPYILSRSTAVLKENEQLAVEFQYFSAREVGCGNQNIKSCVREAILRLTRLRIASLMLGVGDRGDYGSRWSVSLYPIGHVFCFLEDCCILISRCILYALLQRASLVGPSPCFPQGNTSRRGLNDSVGH